MLFKSKLLISLASVGVVGGTGAGVYYGVIKDKDDTSIVTKGEQAGSTGSEPQSPQNVGAGTPGTEVGRQDAQVDLVGAPAQPAEDTAQQPESPKIPSAGS